MPRPPDDFRGDLFDALQGIRDEQTQLRDSLCRWQETQSAQLCRMETHMLKASPISGRISRHSARSVPDFGQLDVCESNGKMTQTSSGRFTTGSYNVMPLGTGGAESMAIGTMASRERIDSGESVAMAHSKTGSRVSVAAMEEHERMAAGMGGFVEEESEKTGLAALREAGPPDNCLVNIVAGGAFTNSMSVVILLNTLFIGFETNAANVRLWEEPGMDAPEYFRSINLAFTGIFSVELVLRLLAFQYFFFLGDEWHWNIFDTFLVTSAVAQEAVATLNFSFVRILRVFRVVRVMRIIRVLRFFTELRRMVCAIVSSMVSLAWAFALLLLITYVFAIFIMQGAHSYVSGVGIGHSNSDSLKPVCGDLYQAMYSLIMAISGGADWGPMADAIAPESKVYQLAFVAYVVFVVFGVLNVLTGVFVAESAQVMDRDLLILQEMTQKRQFAQGMKAIFEDLDPDGSGNVTQEEFQDYLKDPRLAAYFEAYSLDTTDVGGMFRLLDHDGSGEIKTMDFITGCFRLKGAAKAMHVRKMHDELKHKLGELMLQVEDMRLAQEVAGVQRQFSPEDQPFVSPNIGPVEYLGVAVDSALTDPPKWAS